MEQNKKYFVFISYSNQDNEWAVWLRHELEHYHLPASFNGRTDVRESLREVFRDRDELSAGPEWDQQVQKALENTNNLIVICSPNSAKSEAVNKEVEAFIAMGKGDCIFPFIVDGNSPDEYFPKSLEHSKVGGDVNKDGGRDAAFVKVVSGMLQVNYSDLWNRYELEKAEMERKQREQRDNLLRLKSRFIAEKASKFVDDNNSYMAKRLLLEVLPQNILNPDIPLTKEAEESFVKACQHETMVLEGGNRVSAAISPDGEKIATSDGTNNIIHVFDIKTGVCLNVLEGHTNYIASVEYNTHGTLLASASFDKTIRIWDTASGKCKKILKGHNEDVVRVFWGPDEDVVTSYSYNETREWNINSGECLSIQPANRWYGAVRDIYPENLKSIDGRITISIEKNVIIVVDKKKGKRTLTCSGEIMSAKLTKDGSRLVTANRTSIQILDIIDKNEELVYERLVSGTRKIVFNPSNSYMILNSERKDFSSVLHIFNQNSRSCIETINDIPEVGWLTSSPTDNYIAFSSVDDNSIRIWDITKESYVKVLSSHTDTVNYISFSPDGRFLASATKDGLIQIWNIDDGNCIKEIKEHKNSVNSVEFCDDGSKLVSASDDGSVCVWDTVTWSRMAVFRDFNGYYQEVNHASFDHTGEKIVVSPSEPRTWNRIIELNTGNQFDFPALGYSFFSPDDKKLISYNYRVGTFHIWDVSRMIKICDVQGYVAAFDKTGEYVYYVSGYDCKIRRIHSPLTLQELIDETRERFKDNPLTSEERRQYYLE